MHYQEQTIIPGKAKPIISGWGTSQGVTSPVWDLVAGVSGHWGNDKGHSTLSIYFINSSQNLVPRYFCLPFYLSDRIGTPPFLFGFVLLYKGSLIWKNLLHSISLDSMKKHLANTYHVPDIVLSTLPILTHLILITSLWGKGYSFHFTDEETEAKGDLNDLHNVILLVSGGDGIWTQTIQAISFTYTLRKHHGLC